MNELISKDENTVVNIEQITTEIIVYKYQTIQNYIEIGKRLIIVKKALPHGEWIPYLKNKVDFTERTAQRIMKVASEFSNTTATSFLPTNSIGKMFELLALPSEDVEQFVKENDIESMSQKKLREKIKEVKELKENNRILQSERDEFKNAVEDMQDKLNKTRNSFSTVNEDRIKLKAENSRLLEENQDLNEALAQGGEAARAHEEYTRKIKAELDELRKTSNNNTTIVTQDNPKTLARIKKLEKELEDSNLLAGYDALLTDGKRNITNAIQNYCTRVDFFIESNHKTLAKKHIAIIKKILNDALNIIKDQEKDLEYKTNEAK